MKVSSGKRSMRSIDSPRSSDPKLLCAFPKPLTPNSIRCGGANTNAPRHLNYNGGYGIKMLVLTPNSSQEYPLYGIYTRPLPLYKPTQ